MIFRKLEIGSVLLILVNNPLYFTVETYNQILVSPTTQNLKSNRPKTKDSYKLKQTIRDQRPKTNLLVHPSASALVNDVGFCVFLSMITTHRRKKSGMGEESSERNVALAHAMEI